MFVSDFRQRILNELTIKKSNIVDFLFKPKD